MRTLTSILQKKAACLISNGTISAETNLAILSGSSTEKPAKRRPCHWAPGLLWFCQYDFYSILLFFAVSFKLLCCVEVLANLLQLYALYAFQPVYCLSHCERRKTKIEFFANVLLQLISEKLVPLLFSVLTFSLIQPSLNQQFSMKNCYLIGRKKVSIKFCR